MSDSGVDWEDAFANAAYIEGGEGYPAVWRVRASNFRENANGKLDVRYGPDERETLDIFLPPGPAKGLSVFIHGGFWMAFGKSDWSDLAQGALEQGWAMAIPQYTLAPQARIATMTQQIAKAISQAAARVAGPIHLSGHSAGGHLASRMICKNSPLPSEVLSRVKNVVSISGVHDLRPLRLHSMNETLQMDQEEATSESPALLDRHSKPKFTAWVGEKERPEFLRQSARKPQMMQTCELLFYIAQVVRLLQVRTSLNLTRLPKARACPIFFPKSKRLLSRGSLLFMAPHLAAAWRQRSSAITVSRLRMPNWVCLKSIWG